MWKRAGTRVRFRSALRASGGAESGALESLHFSYERLMARYRPLGNRKWQLETAGKIARYVFLITRKGNFFNRVFAIRSGSMSRKLWCCWKLSHFRALRVTPWTSSSAEGLPGVLSQIRLAMSAFLLAETYHKMDALPARICFRNSQLLRVFSEASPHRGVC